MRTKHTYLKHHFVREFIEDRDEHTQGEIFKIEFEFNTSYIGTKNVDVGTLNCLADELDEGVPPLREIIYGKNLILG